MMKIEVYRSKGKWWWRLVARNGEIVCNSAGQGHENLKDCKRIARKATRRFWAFTVYEKDPRNA